MTNHSVTIELLNPADQLEISQFVLGIQNGEFNLGFLDHEQPDLLDLTKFYSDGGFWTAKLEDKIIGTIGLQKLANQSGILRKMFVDQAFRGKPYGLAQRLLETLLAFARRSDMKILWLDSPAVATASHAFYERNGFQLMNKSSLPEGYTFPDRHSKIYQLFLR